MKDKGFSIHKLYDFLEEMGITISSENLLKETFTHSSYANEHSTKKNNERLEFLGDSILNQIVTLYLFKQFPVYPESTLSKLKAILVSNTSLAEVCHKMKLNLFLRMGSGESSTGGQTRTSNMANLFEAFLATVYIECGYEKVTEIVKLNVIEPQINDIDMVTMNNPKGTLQHRSTAIFQKLPKYHLIKKTGSDHAPHFRIKVNIGHKTYGVGEGTSKKEAEIEAAKQALEKLSQEGEGASCE